MLLKNKSLPIQYRTLNLDRAGIDKENRTVKLSFSSETPVDRWFGREILDHSPESVDMTRLNSGAPLLVHHEGGDQVGVVEQAVIRADKKGEAMVRFSKSARGEEIFQDVIDGIRQTVSVGYRVMKMVLESEEEGEETYRAMRWMPYEISLEPIPADNSVGIGRNEQTREYPVEIVDKNKEAKHMSTPSTVEAPTITQANVDSERAAAIKGEQKRSSEIVAMGNKFGCVEDAQRAIAEGKSIEDFQRFILEDKMKAKPLAITEKTANIGMDEKELRQYSLVKAIREQANGKLSGLEKEASEATSKLLGREARGFLIPNDVAWHKQRESAVAQRAMQAEVFSAGGAFVEETIMGSNLIELLRNQTVVNQLGARNLSGLVGNVAIPKQTGGATAYWLAEGAEITPAQQIVGQVGLTPHRLGGLTAYTKQFLAQSSIGVEAFIREDLMKVLAIAKDLAALNGSGVSGQPRGIINTTGVNTVTYSTLATWAKVVESETALATDNALLGSPAWVTTPGVRGKWKTVTKIASSQYSDFLWGSDGRVNGYPAFATNQVPDNKTIFGNFNDLIMADWAGMDVVVDPYTLAASEQVRIIINLWCDIAVRHAESFCVSTDSGAQS